MRAATAAAAFLILAAAPAAAQQKPDKADDAKPLSYQDAQQVDAGLRSLDGYQVAIDDGQQHKVILKFYDLGSGLRIQIGQSEAALAGALRTYQQLYNGLVAQYADGGQTVPDKNKAAWNEAFAKLQQTSSGVTVPHIKVGELKLDQNPVPASVLAALAPILDK